MPKRVFIIHGWSGRPEHGWYTWAKVKLEELGYEAKLPEMPDTDNPKIETWVPYLAKLVGVPQKDDTFIGHSIGCQTILRYLETLGDGYMVGKVILVAPWGASLSNLGDNEEEEIARPWLQTPINWEKVKGKANSFVSIFSNNDPYVPLEENKKVFEEKLGGEIVVKESMGHFTEDDGIKELPELLKYL